MLTVFPFECYFRKKSQQSCCVLEKAFFLYFTHVSQNKESVHGKPYTREETFRIKYDFFFLTRRSV